MKFKEFDATMRAYEEALDQKIPPGIWPVVRLDGRSFTKLTEDLAMDKPFDVRFRDAMIATAKSILESGFRAIYAYVESDEISVLFSAKDPTFNRKMRKWLSSLAGQASATFTHTIGHPGVFDARICPFPNVEIILDYFSWRQSDSRRNSLNSYCYWLMRQDNHNPRQATKKLEKASLEEKIMLLRSYGINHKEIPSWQRNGVAMAWTQVEKEGFNPKKQQTVVVKRNAIETFLELPTEQQYRDFVQNIIGGHPA